MSCLWSTALSNGSFTTGSVKSQLDGGFLYIFSTNAGTIPASADAAVDASAVLLCKISLTGGATGLTFATPAVNGVLSKTASEAWKGTNAASGNAAFWRFCANSADDGTTADTTFIYPRVQGTCGVDSSAEMILPSVALVSGAEQDINLFNLS
ncbi:hypothetical protein [Dyella sp.]|uniref:hypothetical protein n=1 Tax=Dyella sp. TaxID=1869338 RepID=UPI002FDB6CDB